MSSAPRGLVAAVLFLTVGSTAASPQAKPEDELAAIVKAFLAKDAGNAWEGIDKLPSLRWQPLPARELQNCLPDGGCYARQGTGTVGGRNLTLMATGARTIVANIYLRNGSAPFGETKVLDALKAAGLTAELARCPVTGGAGSTNWYRLTGESAGPGVLSVQTRCNGRPCEGFVLTQSEELPKLQPNQVSLYSDRCAPGSAREAVSRLKPHESLAEAVVALLVPAGGGAAHDWSSLAGLGAGITWLDEGPKPMSMANDPNPMARTGTATYADRKFSVIASGTASQVKTIHLEEMGTHPRGEHMLGVVYERGIQVRLVRCGPIYTESTNNWYSLNSGKTRPAMIRQSIRYDGNQVSDAYELRLDGTLPARDARDRDPGVNGCR